VIQQEPAGATAEVGIGAGFGERLVAYLIDFAILFVINMVVQLVLGSVLGGLVAFVIGIAYVIGFWTTSGATPGKKLMKLQVVQQSDGQIPTVGTAVLRYVGYIASAVVVFLGYLWIIWDPNKEGWHDKIAKTRVIKTG
jgi:uncharacterized RDD family membrane protein YckC